MLAREEIVEEGIVESISGGKVLVKVIVSGGCQECSAKVFCNTEPDKNLVYVKDELGVQKGDHVRISVPGKNIAHASNYIYGVPLLLLLLGVFAGSIIFTSNKEIFSALFSLVLIALYGGIIYFYSKRKDYSAQMPRIILVKRKEQLDEGCI